MRTPGTLSLLLLLAAALAGCRDQVEPTAPAVPKPAFDHEAGHCVVSSNADAGAGSLREKIADASCAIIMFSVTGNIDLTSDQLTIDRDVKIQGPGTDQLTVRRSAATQFRIFDITQGAVEISGLTILGGEATENGGGIRNGGTLTLSQSTVMSNTAGFGGGGVYNSGSLTISHTTIAANSALSGGGIASTSGGLISHSAVIDNSAIASGGGIVFIGTGFISNSTITQNIADRVGGVLASGTVAITYSTIAHNRSLSSLYGAGIEGIGAITLKATMIAKNTSGSGDILDELNCEGDFIDGGYNLEGHNLESRVTCGLSAASNSLVNTDPLLGTLSANGGPTQTLPLLEGSPAINAIPNGILGCGTDPTDDQRGVTRPYTASGACDIGAYEADETAPTITITTPAEGAVFLLGQSVLASFSCQDEPGGSGLASCTGTVPDGSAISTAVAGAHAFTVNAADNANNQSTATVDYTVSYVFEGFAHPVDNNGTLNTAKAGRTIPLKWRLLDANGAPVATLAAVTATVASIPCPLGTTADAVEEYAPGSSGLQNLDNGYYQFNWATSASYANSCKMLKLDLGEGTPRTAQFQFTK